MTMTAANIDTANIANIANILLAAGEMFHGGRPEAVAAEWDGCDFTADGVEQWTAIGVWEPTVADRLDTAGLTPRQAFRAAKTLAGDAIYDCCNGDRRVGDIVRAHRGE
jgi:hypothetical protein